MSHLNAEEIVLVSDLAGNPSRIQTHDLHVMMEHSEPALLVVKVALLNITNPRSSLLICFIGNNKHRICKDWKLLQSVHLVLI